MLHFYQLVRVFFFFIPRRDNCEKQQLFPFGWLLLYQCGVIYEFYILLYILRLRYIPISEFVNFWSDAISGKIEFYPDIGRECEEMEEADGLGRKGRFREGFWHRRMRMFVGEQGIGFF